MADYSPRVERILRSMSGTCRPAGRHGNCLDKTEVYILSSFQLRVILWPRVAGTKSYACGIRGQGAKLRNCLDTSSQSRVSPFPRVAASWHREVKMRWSFAGTFKRGERFASW